MKAFMHSPLIATRTSHISHFHLTPHLCHPCSTPADHEYWRLREQQAEAHKAEIEAARSRLAQTGEEAAQAERVRWGGVGWGTPGQLGACAVAHQAVYTYHL
jgi:hypothetical protein